MGSSENGSSMSKRSILSKSSSVMSALSRKRHLDSKKKVETKNVKAEAEE